MLGVLLTAGSSSRMGRAKALLPFGKTSFARSIVESLKRGGIRHIHVVVGHNPGPIAAHLADLGVTFLYNARWPKGQLTSLQTAIRACPGSCTGILAALVDHPGLSPSTVRKLGYLHKRNPRHILVATHHGRPGHPVVFPRRFFRELLAAPLSRGARAVTRKHSADRKFVAVEDPAVLRDVDTKMDYRAFRYS